MKLALRYIPTEVWVDVICYPWITRKKLGKIVHNFRNRYFAEILQYCLHDRGKRMLKTISLDKDAIIPWTPVPENINFFERIIIGHFDSSALDFLRNISPLFTDVSLCFKFFVDVTKLRTMLDHISPLLCGIHSMEFMRHDIPLVQQYFAPKLAKVKMLTIHLGLWIDPASATLQTCINFCLNWLASEERDPVEPRLLIVHICCADNLQQFCMAVRQQFLSDKSSCTFAIEFICYGIKQVNNFHLENTMGEQLDGQFYGYGNYHIYRHKQVDSARTQLQEWARETKHKSYKSSGIELFRTATIGQIEAVAICIKCLFGIVEYDHF